ncbi:apolipoprotein D-like [Uloborus diversus]|uniref:apolipoprotein D-like n=1 Tax=Uloborus diversus TaxID=327109 RepID=UPI002409BB28|nr:apolipoprotein D-like [Uloborus diversus]
MFSAILLLCLSATVCQAGLFDCPTPEVPKNFSLGKLNGTWYEIESTAGAEMFPRKCSKFVIENKGSLKASLLHKYASSIGGFPKSELWELITPKSSEPAKLQMNPVKAEIMAKSKPVWILDTDYRNYALVYSCFKKYVSPIEEVSILARTRTVHDMDMRRYHDILKRKNVDPKILKKIEQNKNCKE